MVSRHRPSTGSVMINSLAFMGLFYGNKKETIDEIEQKKPLEILTEVALPVFSGSRLNYKSNDSRKKTGSNLALQNYDSP